MVLETAIKKRILNNLRRDYPRGVWFKIHGSPYQERGIPDIIGCYKGHFIAFEIKRPDEYRPPTAYQQMQLDNIQASGGISAVITSWEEAQKIIQKIILQTHY